MRASLAAVAACLLLAGCTSDSDSSNDSPDGDMANGGAAPEPIVFSGSLQGVGYGAFLPVAPPVDPAGDCPLQDRQCATHVIEVPEGGWNVTFTLVGTSGTVSGQGVPAGADYDLFVEDVGESTNPSGQPDVVAKKLAAGSYTAQVVAWNDIDGSYELTVTFE